MSNCKHNEYTLDCAWCGYHKDPHRAFIEAVCRIKELENAIKAHKLAVEDRIKINDVQPIVFGGAHLALWAVLDNK